MKIFFIFCLAPVVSFSTTFTHKFENVLKGDVNCHEIANQLNTAFQSMSGITESEVNCFKDENKFADFELKYKADKRIPIVTTDVYSAYANGQFQKENECTDRLETDIATFENATGLKAWLAYCKKSRYNSKIPWETLIVSFGEAVRTPQISGYVYTTGAINFDETAFVDNLRNSLAKRDAIFNMALSEPQFGFGTMAIFYYAKEKYRFELLDIAQINTKDACLKDHTRLTTALNSNNIESVISYCGIMSTGGLTQLSTLLFYPYELSVRPSTESFKTFKECELNRETITLNYKSNIDKKILDGFCSYDDDSRMFKVAFLKN